VFDRKLARGDNTLGFIANIKQNFVSVDFDNGALNQVTVVEKFECFLDFGQEIIGAADVVDSNLFRTGGRGGCHVV
jgi:hypothetical protein